MAQRKKIALQVKDVQRTRRNRLFALSDYRIHNARKKRESYIETLVFSDSMCPHFLSLALVSFSCVQCAELLFLPCMVVRWWRNIVLCMCGLEMNFCNICALLLLSSTLTPCVAVVVVVFFISFSYHSPCYLAFALGFSCWFFPFAPFFIVALSLLGWSIHPAFTSAILCLETIKALPVCHGCGRDISIFLDQCAAAVVVCTKHRKFVF